MNENGRKKREWVKTAAIVFLTVMLILTFFSNTIMNHSLPEVAAQYVESGTITAKIRSQGIVESSDPYSVMVKETRKVASVAVRVGDQVQEGDVLVYLEGGESTEVAEAQKLLDDAKDALKEAQDAYDRALLGEDVDAGVIQDMNGNVSAAAYRKQLTAAQNELEAAQKTVDEWTQKQDAYTRQIQYTTDSYSGIGDDLISSYNTAKEAYDKAESAYQAAASVSGGDAAQLEALKTERDRKEAAYNSAKTALESEQNRLLSNLRDELTRINGELSSAQKIRDEKDKAVKDLVARIGKVYDLDSLKDAIDNARKAVDKAQEEYDKALAKTSESAVTAEIAGTIISINATAGKEVSAAEAVAQIQPEGKGYTMQVRVSNEQAKLVSVGDVAELVNAWRYDDITVTLSGIKPDPENPGQNKLLTFDVSGAVTAGQSLNISLGQKSSTYECIVPNSAVREDNNGKFILIVEAKSGPLNTRYIATRVDVEVLASDETKSAVSGALMGYEFVITTSTKPVEAGEQVRLAEN